MNEATIEAARLPATTPARARDFALDLLLYLTVMFAIRAVHIPGAGFLANGLFWSSAALIVAMWRMHARGITWSDLGLRRPKSAVSVVLVAGFALVLGIGSIMAFEVLKDLLPFSIAPDMSGEAAASKFGDLSGNWVLFASIIPVIWLESMLEELLDRGFLINWLERTFSGVSLATVLAVLLQALIFGFRHSYDLSSRSITVGLIGLAMGIAYVAFGRNLWPLILAHCVLNTASMIERVL